MFSPPAHHRTAAIRRGLGLLAAGALAVGIVSGVSAQAAAAAPASSWSKNVNDSFNRVVEHGLGTASAGGRYSTVAAGSRVSAGKAILGPLAAGRSATVVLPQVRALNQRLRATFVVPTAGRRGYGTFTSVLLRRQADGRAYLGRIRITPTGAVRISLGKFVAHGRFVSLTGERALRWTARPGRTVVIEGEVVGSIRPQVAVRAWAAGAVVPTWQLSATDRKAGALGRRGSVGVFAYRSAGSGAASIALQKLTGWRRSSAAHQLRPTSPTPPTPAKPVMTTAATRTVASAGAVALGRARYSVASSAIYVSPRGSNAVGTGSVDAPYATVQRALTAATDGATIVLRAGTYNQSFFIGKSVTLEAYPGEVVWLDGSVPVPGWRRSGPTWVHSGWSYRFDHSASTEAGSNAGGYVTSAHPMAAYPDQVFRNGSQLTQVADTPGSGQFSVDYAKHTISMGDDPAGASMRASNLSQAIVVGAGNVTLRGFGVRNYATSLPTMGTVYLGGSTGHILLQNLVVEQNATQGISVFAPDVHLDHITSSWNGMTGIHATRSDGLRITNCELSDNNSQHFNSAPAAGGIKVGRLTGVTITGNYVHNNFGITGIWTDENVARFAITNNVVDVRGAEYGILTELSDTGIVAGNVVSNAKYGYTAFDTGHVQVFNNTMAGNSVWDIGLSQDGRYLPGHSTAAVNPTRGCPWVVTGVTVANNDFSRSTASYEFYALDKETKRPADAMHISLVGNLFLDRVGSTGPWPIGWGNGNVWTPTNFATARAWESAHHLSALNLAVVAGVSRIPLSLTVLVPIPATVGAALGVPTGTRHLGAF